MQNQPVRLGAHELSTDAAQNTEMLHAIPGLVDTVCLAIGNLLYIPCLEADEGDWVHVNITVDDKPVIIVKAEKSDPRTVYPVPILSFTPEGIAYIMRHRDPPDDFLICLSELLQYTRKELQDASTVS